MCWASPGGPSMTSSFSDEKLLVAIVDHVIPILTPYEVSAYLLLLRLSWLTNADAHVRIGKRAIANRLGTGARGDKANFEQVSKVIKGLAHKRCLEVGDTTVEGTLYAVKLPSEIVDVAAPDSTTDAHPPDWFGDPDRRRELFGRDGWQCQYCGDSVTEGSATLDHFVPQCQDGPSTPENLRTACFLCNSIKAGKSYEEAAPLLLANLRQRRMRLSSAAEDCTRR